MNDNGMAVQRMSIKEFREHGYLQELNRQFLHPLGLALEIIINEDGSESFGGVWDYRGDSESLCFGEGEIDAEKSLRVVSEMAKRYQQRFARLGYSVQSAPGMVELLIMEQENE